MACLPLEVTQVFLGLGRSKTTSLFLFPLGLELPRPTEGILVDAWRVLREMGTLSVSIDGGGCKTPSVEEIELLLLGDFCSEPAPVSKPESRHVSSPRAGSGWEGSMCSWCLVVSSSSPPLVTCSWGVGEEPRRRPLEALCTNCLSAFEA